MKPLTDRDLDVLDDLIGGYDNHVRVMGDEWIEKDRDGIAPLDFGGSNGSHHGKTATKLVKHGFVEHRKRGAPWGDNRSTGYRGSKVYRPTEAGRAAISAWKTLKKGSVIGSGGLVRKFGHMVPSTQRPLTGAEKTELRLKCHLEMPS